MKEDLKNILLMGLGALSLTGEKAAEVKKELLEQGEKAYKEGSIKNEELKRDIKEKIKESPFIEYKEVTKEDVEDLIKNMTDEEKDEIAKLLNNKKCQKSNKECQKSKESKKSEVKDDKKEENK